MMLRTAFVCASIVLLGAAARAQYSTGFENPPFVSGVIAGQDQWTTINTSTTTMARVLTASEISTELTNAGLNVGQPVHGGTQALLSSGTLGQHASVRSIPGLETENLIRLEVWARPLTQGTTSMVLGNAFLTLEDAAGIRAAAVRFGTAFGQTIDYGSSISNPWVTTNILWDSDTWYRFTFDLDYEANTYNLFVNGAPVTASPISFYTTTSTNFSQVRVFRGNNQAGMIVDDLMVIAIPEPSTAACLLATALLGCRRRR